MSPARDYESRIAALERALGGNPGTFTKSDGVSLKEHLETRLKEQREFFDSRLGSIDKATESARGTMEKRLDGMNEFHDTLKDQQFATQRDMKVAIDTLSGRISTLERNESVAQGKASQLSVNIALLMAAPSLIIGIITLVKMLGGG